MLCLWFSLGARARWVVSRGQILRAVYRDRWRRCRVTSDQLNLVLTGRAIERLLARLKALSWDETVQVILVYSHYGVVLERNHRHYAYRF